MSQQSAPAAVHSGLRQWRQALWRRWLNRRIPPASILALSHRNVFILPSRTGWVFAALLLVMLLTAINYQNSLIYGLTFWLLSMGLSSMWLTFRNLSGLTLSAGQAHPVFCGDTIGLPVQLSSEGWCAGLTLGYSGNDKVEASVPPGQPQSLILPVTTRQRGRLKIRRLRIQSRYPFGLFTAWSWVALDYRVIIYPEPLASAAVLSGDDTGTDPDLTQRPETSVGDEPDGLRDYRPGDSLRRIAWKQSARTGDLRSFDTVSESGICCWFDWASLEGMDAETRLSHLTHWVVAAAAEDGHYGLRLPGLTLQPGQGEQHRRECLEALALWGDV